DASIALRRILAAFIGPYAGHGRAPMRNGREQSPIDKYSSEEWQVVKRGKSASSFASSRCGLGAIAIENAGILDAFTFALEELTAL
ncbi:hypothetical protein, partial [Rhizobium leguminosarum]|uniref:hypothetical protein n=1 Tax=Rhizobium leguminosarum TaxID=384 RepID=UPI003F9A7993